MILNQNVKEIAYANLIKGSILMHMDKELN